MNTKDKEVPLEAHKVLTFWFEETTDAQHFTKDEAFDRYIVENFQSIYDDIVSGKTEHWRSTSGGRLAEIVVLDQFSRNMFRGTAKSFAADELALRLAMEAVKEDADMTVAEDRRGSFYLPYMHSESTDVHKIALRLYEERGGEQGLEYEKKHKKIIDLFGRYPHRNKALGRKSTPEEVKFMKENAGF